MSEGLTARQTQILKALIDEYIKIAEPVGSFALERKYDLGISSATIRSEMVNLTKLGYLKQPHTSAGRIPTPVAMKFYIDQLMEERNLSVVDEVKAKEDVWDVRRDFSKLMEEATHSLAQKTNSLAVSATDDGSTWSSGYSNVFANPEFSSMKVCQSIFGMLEEESKIHELFFEKLLESPMEILFGEELGWDYFEPVGIVATRFNAGGKKGAIGIVGSFGLNYPTVIPTVRYFGTLISELLGA